MKFSSEDFEGLLKGLGVDESTILEPILENYNIVNNSVSVA